MIFSQEFKQGRLIMEQTLIALIVVFLLLITLGIQLQIRSVSKKLDELLNRKS
jgi:hypothetical protein